MSTPVQRQYQDLKKQNPEAILFFRLGDFYELFFEDAKVGARILGIVLTARHKGTENEMPMCGFPYHAHEAYLETLIASGYKVAIAEQVEDQETKKIHREVVRVVTPGTSMEKGNLMPDNSYYLAAITNYKKAWGCAYADITTGEFFHTVLHSKEQLLQEVHRLAPKELVISSSLYDDDVFVDKLPNVLITPRKEPKFEKATKTLENQFKTKLDTLDLAKDPVAILVCGLALEYLFETQKVELPHLHPVKQYGVGNRMILDAQTCLHLEIFNPIMQDEKNITLWSVFEKSQTPMGGRCLRANIAAPLQAKQEILNRQQAVTYLLEHIGIKNNLQLLLQNINDIERILARLATGRGNARDLVFLRDALEVFPELKTLLESTNIPYFKKQSEVISLFDSVQEVLALSLVDEPPVEITQGGMIRDGYDDDLDEYRNLSSNADKWLNTFLDQNKKETGIATLRVKYHKNFGFCLEVPTGQKTKVPESWTPRQTLVNAERYTTEDLAEYEQNVLAAQSNACNKEHELFLNLREMVLLKLVPLQKAAQAIGKIDMILTLAKTAEKQKWCRPDFTDDHLLKIEKGRHPSVQAFSKEDFIPNNLYMGSDRLHLITGPNMAGKSTFFVEMTETASILRAATEKSFVILDEIGRGTSTFDGISIAWAITQFMHDDIKAKTLFATHYHELIDLAEELSHAKNYHITVQQKKDGILFLRTIKSGGMSDSFGVEVAALAGVPEKVIMRAKEVLLKLESENLLSEKPNLFSLPKTPPKTVQKSAMSKHLKMLQPDNLSPKEALEEIYKLKKLDTNI